MKKALWHPRAKQYIMVYILLSYTFAFSATHIKTVLEVLLQK